MLGILLGMTYSAVPALVRRSLLDGRGWSRCASVVASGLPARAAAWAEKDGEHAWLEEVDSERALEWVRSQNALALDSLGEPSGSQLYERIYGILTSRDKIPYALPRLLSRLVRQCAILRAPPRTRP